MNEAELLFDYVFDAPFNFMFVNLQLGKNKRIFKNFNQLEIVET